MATLDHSPATHRTSATDDVRLRTTERSFPIGGAVRRRRTCTSASASALLMLLTAGCALNTIRLDRATAMGEAGRAATAGTGKAMDALRSTNRDVLVDLVATDPNCALPNPVVAGGRADAATMICRAGALQPGDFPLRRWGARELRPSLAVIEALATYLGAVDAVVARKPLDLGGELADAEAKLAGLAGDLTTIAGAAPPPQLSADQQAAVQGTLALLSEVIDEAGRVDDLRKMELALDPAAFKNDLAALGRLNDGVVNRLGAQLQNQQTLLSLQLRQAREMDERRALAARSLDVIDARAALPELRRTLKASVSAFGTAHEDYRKLLLGGGKLTRAERRRAASITQARVLAALHDLALVVKAF